MKTLHSLFMLALVGGTAAAGTVDLTGKWKFALDPGDLGINAAPADWRFPDGIELPGTVTGRGFGEPPSFKTAWTGDGWRYPGMFKEWQADGNFKFPFFLQPPKQYAGPAWFQREIVIPDDWKGMRAMVCLERVHWQSIAWVDGREAGKSDSLGTPHEFDLGELSPGKHTLTLRIDNRLAPVNVGPLSHSVTDHTQGNWNGVVGRMEMRAVPKARITRLEIFPDVASGRVRVRVHTEGLAADEKATLSLTGRGLGGGEGFGASAFSVNGPVTEGGLMVPNPRLWNEFSPNLYRIDATLKTPTESHSLAETFGFREVGTKDGRITINGRKTFLRGTLECCIFPLTGHPPVDVESWKRIVRICKAHGLNHIRFHSWCPPEAAFAAADELGFYYQVEVSSWANQGAEIGSGGPLDAWIEIETKRMLDAYGNHPSFLLMAYGNEPGGKNHAKWLQDWVARRKAEDPRRLYTTGAGWPVMPGSDYHSSPDPRIQAWGGGLKSILNAEAPRTDFDWSGFVKNHSDAPVISHEIGQWCVYPNFDEIAKYTGYFKARNFEIFRETAERAGLLEQSKDFLRASGKWQAAAYKHDIEAALRTPGFGGFQLLDLHDFPGQGTALVGVLDAFWDEKGYISPEEYKRFCGPIVPLARMKKMVWTNTETLEADLEIAQFGPEDLANVSPAWSLTTAGGVRIAKGNLPARDLTTGSLHSLGSIRIPLSKVEAPAKLTLTIGAAGKDFVNSWEVFVYPEKAADPKPGNFVITRSLDEAKKTLAKGGNVLWMPPAVEIRNDPDYPLVSGFSPIFWNTAWTNWQPPHTLGILCKPEHPALASFPTDMHSNWQWWEIQKDAQPFILTDLRGVKPIIQVIDDWFTNRKLGYVFEARVGAGKLLACSLDLDGGLSERPAARQLRSSLLEYVKGGSFAPSAELEVKQLDALLRPAPVLIKMGATVSASSQEEGHAASFAIDGNPKSLWHTEYSSRKPEPPHQLSIDFPAAVAPAAVLITQRQDRNANGQVADVEILDGTGKSLARAKVPKDAQAYEIKLPSGIRVQKLIVKVHTSHSGPFASMAELDLKM